SSNQNSNLQLQCGRSVGSWHQHSRSAKKKAVLTSNEGLLKANRQKPWHHTELEFRALPRFRAGGNRMRANGTRPKLSLQIGSRSSSAPSLETVRNSRPCFMPTAIGAMFWR